MLDDVPRQPVVPSQLTTGPFTSEEAFEAGLTRRQLHGPAWRRLGGGFFVRAGQPVDADLRLAIVRHRLSVGAAFSDRTAAWLHGIDLAPCDPVEVTVPDVGGVSRLPGVRVHRRALGGEDVDVRRGLPVTSPLRTAIDLGGWLPLVDAVVAVDMVLRGRMVDIAELRAYVADHPGTKGVGRLRRVLELAEPRSESPMETRLRLLLVLAGLPPPRVQVTLHDKRDRFVGRPDLYYTDQRLAVEYDGDTHRTSLPADDRRQNRFVAAGIRLLRFTSADIYRTPDSVVEQVRAALDATR